MTTANNIHAIHAPADYYSSFDAALDSITATAGPTAYQLHALAYRIALEITRLQARRTARPAAMTSIFRTNNTTTRKEA